MQRRDAKAVIRFEAFADDGLVTRVRMGEEPGAERMAALLEALQQVFADREGKTRISRELAYDLFSLSFHVEDR